MDKIKKLSKAQLLNLLEMTKEDMKYAVNSHHYEKLKKEKAELEKELEKRKTNE